MEKERGWATGDKLQGASVDNILVNDWVYTQNWHYVVLSRVRTMAGLYLMQPLSEDLSLYTCPPAYFTMIEHFRSTCLAAPLPDALYESLQRD